MERALQRDYANYAEAKLGVPADFAGFYKYERLHRVLGNPPSSVYERTMVEKELTVLSEII